MSRRGRHEPGGAGGRLAGNTAAATRHQPTSACFHDSIWVHGTGGVVRHDHAAGAASTTGAASAAGAAVRLDHQDDRSSALAS